MNRAETERTYAELDRARAAMARAALKLRGVLDDPRLNLYWYDDLGEVRRELGEAMIATGRAEHRLEMHTTLEPTDDVGSYQDDRVSTATAFAAAESLQRLGMTITVPKGENVAGIARNLVDRVNMKTSAVYPYTYTVLSHERVADVTEAGELRESVVTHPGIAERTACNIVPMPNRKSRDPDTVDARLLIRYQRNAFPMGTVVRDLIGWLRNERGRP